MIGAEGLRRPYPDTRCDGSNSVFNSTGLIPAQVTASEVRGRFGTLTCILTLSSIERLPVARPGRSQNYTDIFFTVCLYMYLFNL